MIEFYNNNKKNISVGVFVVVLVLLFIWSTIKVSDRTSVSGSGYELEVLLQNATGLKNKAPVELAGVQIGVVKKVELTPERVAKALLILNKNVKLPDDSVVILRTRGFLGETYVEIIPGTSEKYMDDGNTFASSYRTGDINSMVSQFSEIATDIKTITTSLKEMTSGDSAPVRNTVNNMEQFTETLKEITLRNEANFDRIASNLSEVTAHLREVMAASRQNVEDAISNMASITDKINRGEGTIGKLVNDEENVEQINDAVDNLNETLGGFKKLEAEIGYHAEYLTDSTDFKHYISLGLKPAPDKAFLLDIISDPNPRASRVEKVTDITVGNNTSTVTTETATIERSEMKFSAQIAKKFYDLQLRGGLIESSGGVGLDYYYGPVEASFSAFDFSTRFGEKPHLKAWGTLNLTKNLYVVGGADDFINPNQSVDYFFGAGLRLIDDDIKSLFPSMTGLAK